MTMKQSALSTTAHGLPHIFSASKHMVVKLIWLVCTLVSIGFCCFMIINATRNFLNYGKTSIIRQSPQEQLTFPALSICNQNPFVTREAWSYMQEYVFEMYGANVSSYKEITSLNVHGVQIDEQYAFYYSFLPYIDMSMRRSFGYSLDDILLKCEFNSQPCNLSWFDWFYHPYLGNCYKFNSGELNGGFFYIRNYQINFFFRIYLLNNLSTEFN
jgi:hypothetical protein